MKAEKQPNPTNFVKKNDSLAHKKINKVNEKDIKANEKDVLLNESHGFTSTKDQEIFTDREAAEFLRVSQVTLWRERKKGKLDFRRVGAGKIIYTKKDLENYLANQMRVAYAVN